SYRQLDEGRGLAQSRARGPFRAELAAGHPDGSVIYRDLAADPVPHLDWHAFTANFVADEDRTAAQREARALTETLTGEVLAADEIVIRFPLYNLRAPRPLHGS